MLICFLISIAEGDTLSYVLPHYINYFCSPTYKNTYWGFLQAFCKNSSNSGHKEIKENRPSKPTCPTSV